MIAGLQLALALALPGAVDPVGALADAPLVSDHAVEIVPPPQRGRLEEGMPPEIAAPYQAGLAALRAGDYRGASVQVRRARALSYRQSVHGPLARLLAQRYLLRTGYVEVQLSELLAIDEQLPRITERQEEHATFLQVRAMLLHNLFLAVRGYTGQSDARLVRATITAYEVALSDPGGHLRSRAQIGYAAILGERGELRAARAEFAKLADKDAQTEDLDLPIAYYYLAVGERGRALSRLLLAARRDSWDHPAAQREGATVRSQVYRMNDFDRLRDDPRFRELVTQPEEHGGQSG